MNNAANCTSYKPGHKHSPETLAKISASKIGATPWNKGIKSGPREKKTNIVINCGNCGCDMRIEPNQVGRKKFCSKTCFYEGRTLKGLFKAGHADLVPKESRGHSSETKRKISESGRELQLRGDKSANWKGGLRTERKAAMGRFEYKDWRTAVFKRDNYTCVICGIRGAYLEADHIKPWCLFPDLRYKISNGRTLCKQCHLKQETHGRKALKFNEAQT